MDVLIVDNIYFGSHYYSNIIAIEYDEQQSGFIVLKDKDGETFSFFKKDISSISIVEGKNEK